MYKKLFVTLLIFFAWHVSSAQCITSEDVLEKASAYDELKIQFWQAEAAKSIRVAIVKLEDSETPYFNLVQCDLRRPRKLSEGDPLADQKSFEQYPPCVALGRLWMPLSNNVEERQRDMDVMADFYHAQMVTELEDYVGSVDWGPTAQYLANDFPQLIEVMLGLAATSMVYKYSPRNNRWQKWGRRFSLLLFGGYLAYEIFDMTAGGQSQIISKMKERSQQTRDIISQMENDYVLRMDGQSDEEILLSPQEFEVVQQSANRANQKTYRKFCQGL